MKHWISFVLLWLVAFIDTQVAQDSLRLDFDEYKSMVERYHPLNRIGELLLEGGKVAELEARGGFDPKVNAELSEKRFKDDPYYSILNSDLSIPTPLGLKVNSGYDRTSGVFLNPEDNVPDEGLLYAGVSLPLARGLLFDERRAQLKKAAIIQDMNENERRMLLNQLAYDSGSAYWQWWMTYEYYNIYQEASDNALELLRGVRVAAVNGDRASIDTVEARIQYQSLVQLTRHAQMEFAMSGFHLSTFLWNESGQPQLISEMAIPGRSDDIEELLLDLGDFDQIEAFLADHPELLQYELKNRELSVSKRLAREDLKPTLDVKYNFLVDPTNSFAGSLSPNNYTWGLKLSMPLLFRKERAKLKQVDIKIAENQFDQELKRNEVYNKIEAYKVKWRNYSNQYKLYRQVVSDYLIMLEGERALFENGESSLFLINARQAKYIDAQLKLRELYASIRIARMETYFSSGLMAD